MTDGAFFMSGPCSFPADLKEESMAEDENLVIRAARSNDAEGLAALAMARLTPEPAA